MNLDLISKHITPDFVIDIGANVGGFYLEAKAAWPDSCYLLIEGNNKCTPALAALNVDFTIALLSDGEKEVKFFTLKDADTATGASYYRENTEFFSDDRIVSTLVKTTTLDEVCKKVDLSGRVLAKIDTQGSELDILRGGVKTIAQVEAILMEVTMPNHEYNIGAPRLEEVSRYMAEIGFHFAEKIGEIVHPITREHIQSDILYLRP